MSEKSTNKTKNGFTKNVCRLCRETVLRDKKRHIFKYHLKLRSFTCPHCMKTSGYLFDIKKHINLCHKGEGEPIDARGAYDDEYQQLRERCFGVPQIKYKEEKPQKVDKKIEISGYFYCTLCRTSAWRKHQEDRIDHVINTHIKNLIYYCPHCSNANLNSEIIRRHIHTAHGGEGDPTVNTTVYEKEIDNWTKKCFGGLRLQKPDEGTNSDQKTRPDVTLTGLSALRSRNNHVKTFCFLCKKNFFKDKNRHVYEFHIKKPSYGCSLCPSYVKVYKHKVATHIQAAHGGKGEIRDIRSEFRAEFNEWVIRCFGRNDPISSRKEDEAAVADLVRAENSAQQKENDYCNICQTCDWTDRDKTVHLLDTHIKNLIYYCPHCSNANLCSKVIRRHIISVHWGEGEPCVNEAEYHEQVTEWMEKCFGRERRPYSEEYAA